MKIALSGIPGIGKSTLLNQIQNEIEDVMISPEAARYVIELYKGTDINITENRKAFQNDVFLGTYILEKYMDDVFINSNIVLDRSIFDNIIFSVLYGVIKLNEIDVALNKIKDLYNKQILKKYDAVILMSIKNPNRFVYANKDFVINKILKDDARKQTISDDLNHYIDIINEWNMLFDKIIKQLKHYITNKVYYIYLDSFLGDNFEKLYNERNKYIIELLKFLKNKK